MLNTLLLTGLLAGAIPLLPPVLDTPRPPAEPMEFSYGDHPLQRLDVWAPTPCRPTVVWVHGGGFARGDKRPDTMLARHFRQVMLNAGFTVVSLNYRLAADTLNVPPQHPWDDKFPAAHDDVMAALAWLHDHQAETGTTWPVTVAGESAGGNLAFHLARQNPTVRAAFLVGAYTDLVEDGLAVGAIAENYLGCTLEDCPKLWRMASPALQPGHVSPLLLWHGQLDPAVPHTQSLASARANVPGITLLRIVPGAGHTGEGFITPALDAEVREFLTRYGTTRPACR